MRHLLLVLSFILFASSDSIGQIGLYDRILDPLGIADLGGPDSMRPLHTSLVHAGFDLEQDGYRVFAKMQGPGIVSHIWATWVDGLMDTTSMIKVTIDDTLIYHGVISKFFVVGTGRLRGPLDSTQSGGLVCDIPLPYKRNFKLTYQGSFSFFALTWRGVSDSSLIYSFRPWDTSGVSEQVLAEAVISRSSIGELSPTNESVASVFTLGPGGSKLIFDDNNQGVIQQIHFVPQDFDTSVYRQLWLRCYWDGDPVPAIDVPLADLFGAVNGIHEIDALQLKASAKHGFNCLLPMPFAQGAKIEITNRSQLEVSLSAQLSIDRNPRSSRDLGRLNIQFNDLPVPRMHHLLPIAHAKGRGRFIGVIFNMPHLPDPPFYLEGDPKFVFDSSDIHRISYPGTEDYFNGGWYFSNGDFSLPFAGCPKRWSTLYRFNYLDLLNFNSSVDVDWEHGRKNDYFEAYRTVAFFYLEARHFWVLTDTLLSGEYLKIGGSGYQPLSAITISFDANSSIVMADGSGKFQLELSTSNLSLGDHSLNVNGEPHFRPISILSAPIVEYVVDSQYSDMCISDSLSVTLRGYKANRGVDVFLSSQLIGQANTDARGCAWLSCKLIDVQPGSHSLIGVQSSLIGTAGRLVTVTPSLRYEVEDLIPLSSDCPFRTSNMGWYNEYWSNNKIVFIAGSKLGDGLTFKLDVPYSDTFKIAVSATKGVRYANMGVSIDGQYVGTVDGYFDVADFGPYLLPARELSAMYLTRGLHEIRFSVESRDARAVEWAIGPDLLLLTPQTENHGIPGKQYSSLSLDYSVASNSLFLHVPDELINKTLQLEVVDALGKPVCPLLDGLSRAEMEIPLCSKEMIRGAYFAICRFDGGPQITRLVIQ